MVCLIGAFVKSINMNVANSISVSITGSIDYIDYFALLVIIFLENLLGLYYVVFNFISRINFNHFIAILDQLF